MLASGKIGLILIDVACSKKLQYLFEQVNWSVPFLPNCRVRQLVIVLFRAEKFLYQRRRGIPLHEWPGVKIAPHTTHCPEE